MKVLVLGGDGMLGHQVARRLSHSCEVVAAVRKPAAPAVIAALKGCRVISGVDLRVPDAPQGLLLNERPRVVINTAGIVKQRVATVDPTETIEVNSLFPHRLAAICRLAGARLIHISTDCVFSGNRGDYQETDDPDPSDFYGRTKLLGEVTGDDCLTIRTSIIGLELAHYSGLIEWFLRQQTVRGYRRARWNGLTTAELASVIDTLVNRSDLDGLWHVSAEPISKYQLLADLAALLNLQTAVVPDDTVVIDRSLNSERFRATLPYTPPTWEQMLQELASAVRDREGSGV